MSQIALSTLQMEILRDVARFKVVVAGRRGGKTYLQAATQIRKACSKRGSLNWLILPTHRMAKRLGFDRIRELIPPRYVRRILVSELRLETVWDAVIECRSAENYDSLRGPALDFVGLDEFGSMAPETWTEVIRPALSDKMGGALITGTPTGVAGAFYTFYQRGLGRSEIGSIDADVAEKLAAEQLNLNDWKSWQYTTIEGGWVSPEEVASARAELDPRTFRQEYEASFESLGNRVVYAFDRHVHVDGSVADDGLSDLVIGMDFNVNPMSACVGRLVTEENKKTTLYVFDEFVMPSSNTFEMGSAIVSKYGHRGLTAYEAALKAKFEHIEQASSTSKRRGLTVYPDASGRSRHTSAVPGQTDFVILEQAGLRVSAPSKNPPVKNRINVMNSFFRTGTGEVRCLVSPRCKTMIRTCDGWGYAEGSQLPDKTSGLDHMGDAFGYLAVGLAPTMGLGQAWTESIFGDRVSGEHTCTSESFM